MFEFLLRAIFVVAIFSVVQPASATPNPNITAVINGVNDDKTGPTLTLSNLNVDLKQHGSMAEFTIEARIFNPSEDEVEGRFSMQLPKDAVLVGYALDVNGRMVSGSLIDQPKAKQVFEDEVRAGIDPGLAEISSSNKFETRIYPIAAHGYRTIRLSFVTPVDVKAGLSIPLETASPVENFTFNADVTGLSKPPLIKLPGGKNIPFKRAGLHWRSGGFVMQNREIEGALTISGVALKEKITVSKHSTRKLFFTIEDELRKGGVKLDQTERVRVYWDRSRSRNDAFVDEERALLNSFLVKMKPAAIDIVRFASDDPDKASFQDAVAANDHLSNTTYRGATSFAGLDKVQLEDADICLLFSDGGITLNEQAGFEPDCPLILIASGPNSDSMKLNRLARDSHGELLYLQSDNAATILTQMQNRPLNVVDIRDVDGRRIKFRNLPAGAGRWKVVGELPRWGDVTARLSGLPKGKRNRIYSMGSGRAIQHDAAGAIWASQAVASLSEDPGDRKKMRKMAERFQVASPTMAFLVLERPDQYIRADIVPPKAFNEEWMEEFAELKEEQEEEFKTEKEDRFEFVLAEWEETKEWWATSFDQKKAMRQAKRNSRNNRRNRREESEAVEEPAAEGIAPAPPPPPSSPATASSGEADSGYAIIVTGSRRRDTLQESPLAVTAISSRDADGNVVKVEINDVLSSRPYLDALGDADKADRLSVLTEQEKTYGALPAFYLDVSEWFRLKGDKILSIELLLSALELPTTNDETRLVVAFRLQRAGRHDDAIALLERMEATSGYRPQPKRTLALALAERSAIRTGAQKRKDLERAFKLLTDVALNPAVSGYDGIETISLMEANSLVPLIDAAGGKWSLDERLIALLDTDIRIVIEWTNADADLDLWVTEPSTEKASYNHQRTRLGGKMSNDMTSGYGPEEYVLKNAVAGEYQVRVQGYSGDRINPNGPGRVMVRLIRNFGRKNMRQDLVDSEIGFDRSNKDDNDRAIATMKVSDD